MREEKIPKTLTKQAWYACKKIHILTTSGYVLVDMSVPGQTPSPIVKGSN